MLHILTSGITLHSSLITLRVIWDDAFLLVRVVAGDDRQRRLAVAEVDGLVGDVFVAPALSPEMPTK